MIANGTAIVQRPTRNQRSIKIRLRERKGVLDQFYPGFRAFSDDNLHDVEAEKYFRVLQHTEPGECAARNSLLFCAVDGFQWPAEIFARAGFYFDEHERVIVSAYNVDFAATAPTEIAKQNFITATLQEPARQFLAPRAAPEMTGLGRFRPGQEAVAPLVRKIGDGSDKARIHEASKDAVLFRNLCAG